MIDMIKRRLSGSGRLILLGVLLAALSGHVFGQDDDLSTRIDKLEKELEAVKAEVQAGEDVTARIAELEAQLTELKAAAGEVKGESKTITTNQLPPAGVQGSPNPLRDDTKYLTGDDLLDEAFPNSIPVPGSNVRVAFGGYAKLDIIQDLDYVGNRFEFSIPSIPVSGTPESELDGLSTLHAKQTRFNADFRSKAKRPNGDEYPLQAYLEFDFFDDRQEFKLQPRLRHAYGVIGRLLAGQTWATAGDLDAVPGTIDFAAGDALYGDRVAQVRWEDQLGSLGTWAVALEENKGNVGNPLGLDGENRAELPDLAARMRLNKNRSHVQLAGDIYQLGWQGGSTGPSDTALAWGVNLTTRILLGLNSNNALMGGVAFGDGSAQKIVSFRGSGNDGVITPGGLETLKFWQAYGGYSVYWTPSLNSTFSVAWAEVDNSEFQPDDQIHAAKSAHVNLIWFPYKLVSTGMEIMWGERENKNGASGTATRIQGMIKYKFN